MEDPLLRVGRVVKTQGIKGEVRVSSPGMEALAQSRGKTVYLEDPEGNRRALTVESTRSLKKLAVLAFREIKSIEEAQKLIGCFVYAEKKNLSPLPPDEFYWYQLRGLRVKTEEGRDLGILEGVFATGSNDVFLVRKEGKEILIPATEEVIARVDLQEKVMIIRPLEGLLPEDDL
jgi:16S rRNA processing protein RimM